MVTILNIYNWNTKIVLKKKKIKIVYLDVISWVLMSYVDNHHRIYSRNTDIKKKDKKFIWKTISKGARCRSAQNESETFCMFVK